MAGFVGFCECLVLADYALGHGRARFIGTNVSACIHSNKKGVGDLYKWFDKDGKDGVSEEEIYEKLRLALPGRGEEGEAVFDFTIKALEKLNRDPDSPFDVEAVGHLALEARSQRARKVGTNDDCSACRWSWP
jgi:hypothetical protein